VYEFFGTIAESRLIPSQSNLRNFEAEDLCELVVLYICALYILHSFEDTERRSHSYTKRTIQYGTNWEQWKSSGTDLYVMLYGLRGKDAKLKNQTSSADFRHRLPFGGPLLTKWLRELASGSVSSSTHRTLFTKLDANFKISNSSIRAVRRMTMDWDHLNEHDRRLTVTRLIQLLRARASKSELLSDIRELASRHDLELSDVCDRETGIGCGSEIVHTTHKDKPNKTTSFLVSLAGLAAGVAIADALDKRKNS